MSESIALTPLANSAAQFFIALDSGASLSTIQLTDAQGNANNLLTSWYNEQTQALSILIQEQQRAGASFIAQQLAVIEPLLTAFVLAGASGLYSPQIYTPGSTGFGTVPQFADLTTPVTVPNGYALALKLNLAILIAPQFGAVVTPELLKSALEARAAANPMPTRIPIPGLDPAPLPAGASGG